MFNLVCVNPFANFEKGQIIEDQKLIAELMSGENEGRFVKVVVPQRPQVDAAPIKSKE